MLFPCVKLVNRGFIHCVFLVVLSLLPGCATMGGGPRVLTVSELADRIYQDLGWITSAIDQYRSKFDTVPPTTREFVESGIIEAMPVYPEGIGQGEYAVRARYDDMDGVGELDGSVYTGDSIPAEVCREFNIRYATPPLNTAEIFDYQAAGNKYPGEVYGRQIRTYAIKWQTANNTCEINQVLRYND